MQNNTNASLFASPSAMDAPSAQASNAQASDAQASDAQASDAQASDGAWVRACASAALRNGKLTKIRVGAREGVVWRGESGQAAAVDAYCPHLGAHLAEGWVEGEELVCPFHRWRFANTGRCTAIGYASGEAPARAETPTWDVRERDGAVWAKPPVVEPLRSRGADQVPTLPGRYPEGWYKVGFSHELHPGQVLPVRYFARNLELSRSLDGTLSVTIVAEPYPQLTTEPRRDNEPASVKSMRCIESGGIIMAWYGAGEPTYDAPDYSAYEDPSRSRRIYSEAVSSSLWDVAENPFDFAHLATVHHLDVTSEPRVEPDGAILHLHFDAHPAPPVGPRSIGRLLHVSTHVRAFGLGLTDTHISFDRFIDATWMIGCNTPIDDNHTDYTLMFFAAPGAKDHFLKRSFHHFNAGLVWELTEVERVVWRKKRYLKHPYLTRNERGLGRFRKWAKQFRCS